MSRFIVKFEINTVGLKRKRNEDEPSVQRKQGIDLTVAVSPELLTDDCSFSIQLESIVEPTAHNTVLLPITVQKEEKEGEEEEEEEKGGDYYVDHDDDLFIVMAEEESQSNI